MKYLILTLMTLSMLFACDSKPKPDKTPPKTNGGQAAHQGPHGGEILEAGDHVAHVEVIHDEKAGTMTLYILGADVKTPMPLAKSPQVKIMTDDGPKVVETVGQDSKDGKATHFVATDDVLKKHGPEGRISIEIDGKTYSPELAHKAH